MATTTCQLLTATRDWFATLPAVAMVDHVHRTLAKAGQGQHSIRVLVPVSGRTVTKPNLGSSPLTSPPCLGAPRVAPNVVLEP